MLINSTFYRNHHPINIFTYINKKTSASKKYFCKHTVLYFLKKLNLHSDLVLQCANPQEKSRVTMTGFHRCLVDAS